MADASLLFAQEHVPMPRIDRDRPEEIVNRLVGPLQNLKKERGNSVKMYDKAGSILRVETTIANPADFKVYRPRHDDPETRLEWRPLRKGVADLHPARPRCG